MTEIIAKRPNPDLECMAAIAMQSLEAGEALPGIASARGMVPAYKYGMHLPNWFNGDSPGLRLETEATLPISLTFLDNVKGEGLTPLLEILHNRGVKPDLVYRPYFIPDSGVNPAIVEGYANGAIAKMRDDYFQFPLIRQAYEEGRFIVKLFNETNIGGEGFARGRAGFADALRYWKQARQTVKNAYPKAKFLSIANTPGNDDVWFTGDTPNAPYWYHGAEAAKANPTQAEINAAIQSCPFREMFELCDYIGIHVYANIRSTVDGNLATWYSRRHEQALKFLTPYISAGKKMIINEWDLGYDEGQAYRAEAVVYGLNQIVGLNDAVLFVSQWWNADKNEGAFTWDKHRTREDGVLLPVVHAVKAFREGAIPPPPDPTPPPPPDSPPATFPPRVLVDMPSFVSIREAGAVPGQKFWRITKAERRRGSANNELHHIFHTNPHNAAVNMVIKRKSVGDWIRVPHDKPANEPAANFPMNGQGNKYDVGIEGLGVTLSDALIDAQMYQNQHESFYLTWELVTMPIAETLTDRLAAALRAELGDAFEDLRGTLPVHQTLRYPVIDSRGFDYIAIHHSATEKTRTWANIAGYHVEHNNWAGIGYHSGVRRGKFALFDSVDTERAHVYGMNHEAFGICVTGNYDTGTVDEMDLDVLKRAIAVIDRVYGHEKIIKGHGELRVGGFTACPGSDLKRVLPTLRQAPPPPVIDWGKVVWSIEEAARILEREGYQLEHDTVLSDVSYIEAIRERDK